LLASTKRLCGLECCSLMASRMMSSLPSAKKQKTGLNIADAETPALFVDLDVLERNQNALEKALAKFENVTARPHVKSHKCPEIGKRQLKSSVVKGLSCATVSEVEIMVKEAGARDILLTNEVVCPIKMDKLVELCAANAKEGGDCSREGNGFVFTLCVDNKDAASKLSEKAKDAGVKLGAIIELNCGQNRCGVDTKEQVLALAKHITDSCNGLRFRGIQGYQGASQHIRSKEERNKVSEGVRDKLQASIQLLKQNNLTCEIVTGAGTGTFMHDASLGTFTEVQPGSYLFMDVDYGMNEEGNQVFEPSLFISTTIISNSESPRRFVLDAGLKSHSIESGLPLLVSPACPAYKLRNGGDEHMVVDVETKPGDAIPPLPPVGTIATLQPGHVDPTFNMHDRVFFVRANIVEDIAWICRGPR